MSRTKTIFWGRWITLWEWMQCTFHMSLWEVLWIRVLKMCFEIFFTEVDLDTLMNVFISCICRDMARKQKQIPTIDGPGPWVKMPFGQRVGWVSCRYSIKAKRLEAHLDAHSSKMCFLWIHIQLSGGPNNELINDYETPGGVSAAKSYAGPGTAPHAWGSKENTVNWNAPLAWVAWYVLGCIMPWNLLKGIFLFFYTDRH